MGGDSPVLEYDKEVIKTAVEYLSEDHDKPQCIFVSTYGPHFPYVAPEDLYLHYKEIVSVPDTYRNKPDYLNPLLLDKVKEEPEETVIKARAAYFGMIETIDSHMGLIRKTFNKYVEKNGREGIFTYISDHGDQCGEKGMYGKTTFFEGSARIPFIMEGNGIKRGIKISTAASIMDLGPTLCELAGTNPPPGQDGRSLLSELRGNENSKDRAVISEYIDSYFSDFSGTAEDRLKALMTGALSFKDAKQVISRMVRKGNYKYITYIGFEEYDLLFDLSCDPEEKNNIADKHPDILNELKEIALDDWNYEEIIEKHNEYLDNIRLVKAWEKAANIEESERWDKNPEYAKVMPKVN